MPGYISPNDPRYQGPQVPAGGYISPNDPRYQDSGAGQQYQSNQPQQRQQLSAADPSEPGRAGFGIGGAAAAGPNLQSLLGGQGVEGEVPREVLMAEMNKARENGDMERMRNIRTMIEQRMSGQPPLTTAEAPAAPSQPQAYNGINPFRYLEDLLGKSPK